MRVENTEKINKIYRMKLERFAGKLKRSLYPYYLVDHEGREGAE